jgi:hypothetical protein
MFKVLPALLVMVILAAVSSFAQTAAKPDTNIKVIAVLPVKKTPADSPAVITAAPKQAPSMADKEIPGKINKPVKALILNFFEGRLMNALPENTVVAYDTFKMYCQERRKITVFNPKTCEFETASDSVTTYNLAGKVICVYIRGGQKIKENISDTAETHKSRKRTKPIIIGQ